jgi:hypothetical protein
VGRRGGGKERSRGYLLGDPPREEEERKGFQEEGEVGRKRRHGRWRKRRGWQRRR